MRHGGRDGLRQKTERQKTERQKTKDTKTKDGRRKDWRPMDSLFEDEDTAATKKAPAPLAERMRPRTFDEFVGQQDLLAAGKPLREAIERDLLQSIILWGPPGTGKTTLARIIADTTKARFVSFSAVLAGIKEIREV